MVDHALAQAALQNEGKMVLYCSHVLEVVEKVCSHVTILQKGRQLAYGTVGELKQFQSMPTLEAASSHLVKEADATDAAQHFVTAFAASMIEAEYYIDMEFTSEERTELECGLHDVHYSVVKELR